MEVEGQGVITSLTLQVPPENIEFQLPMPDSTRFRDRDRSVIDIHALAQGENTAAEFAVKLALKPILTPNFVVDRSTVYPGDKVHIYCEQLQKDAWYGIAVHSKGEPSQKLSGFTKGQTFSFNTYPIFSDSTIEVFVEYPLHVRRKLIQTISVTVSRSLPPEDSQTVQLVNTMYGELLPNEFFLGKVPIIRILGSQNGVTYQSLVDGIKVGTPVLGGNLEGFPWIDIAASELKQHTTFVVCATRSNDPNVFTDLKQSVKVIAIPDIFLVVSHSNPPVYVPMPIESGSAIKVFVFDSQADVTYTLVALLDKDRDLPHRETKKTIVSSSSALGTGKTLELPTGPITESCTFWVTAKLPGSRLVELRQEVPVYVKSTPLVN